AYRCPPDWGAGRGGGEDHPAQRGAGRDLADHVPDERLVAAARQVDAGDRGGGREGRAGGEGGKWPPGFDRRCCAGSAVTGTDMNQARKIRVGIIGANPDRGWAAQAHIPALKSLADDFEITALSTSRRESADAAGKRFGVPLAFDNTQDLVHSADVDVVAITVKVPHHFELATAA